MKSQIPNRKSQIVIVGAGPAGSSLAIRLALDDFDVTLIERETFPRHKLCGEFISPECLSHFKELGLLEDLLSAGGERITETRFYAESGRSFAVSSGAFRGQGFALSLSRAEMDMRLGDRAKAVGVTVYEDSSAANLSMLSERITSLTVRRGNGERFEIDADLFVDATGRSRVLSKLLARVGNESTAVNKSLFVGFKSHLKDARVENGTCEIYLFPGGYGGLSPVEGGLTNYCFLVKSSVAREFGGDAGRIVENLVIRNKRAAETLKGAEPVRDWIAVSIDSFGKSETAKAVNLLSVGDSAAFIDPFTGSGMLMAFESSALLAKTIILNKHSPEVILHSYHAEYNQKFAGRLRVSAFLRRVARVPLLPPLAISMLNASKRGRAFLAESTRSPNLKSPKAR